jgi:hypothetical protein
MREPEMVVDLPYRVETETFPVTVIVKDAHKFPLKFASDLELEFIGENSHFTQKFPLSAELINAPFWWTIFATQIPVGKFQVCARLNYAVNGRINKLMNHNFPTLSPALLEVFHSPHPLPRPEGYLLGDLHCHSSYTSDQVEFGAPLRAISQTAKSLGLDFVAITDHTYDMDDLPDNYLKNDPQQSKWNSFLREIAEINYSDPKIHSYLLSGQEITVCNSEGRNVHLLLIGDNRLFPGRGDSAEKWLQTGSEHTITEIITLKSPQSLIAAAHPRSPVAFLQKYLLRRGQWNTEDFHPEVNGAQIANGKQYINVEEGLKFWMELLKRCKNPALWAGNDAHGNFNRFRQVKLPMCRLQETGYHLPGVHRTGIFSPQGRAEIYEGLHHGTTFISNGPALDLQINGFRPGSKIEAGENRIELEYLSSEEFGFPAEIQFVIFKENKLWQKKLEVTDEYKKHYEIKISLEPGFIFAKTLTKKGAFCITSAILVK